MPYLSIPAALLYAVAVLLLAVYGLHSLVLLLRYRRCRHGAPADAPIPPEGSLPRVLVQIPVYNERDVVGRALAAAGALDWPRERLAVQLLDDSDDDTAAIGARAVAALRARGIDAAQIRRADRTGFKAGALAAGLDADDAPLVAIFDADFVPPPDFLRRTVPQLVADEGLAFVQARWEHLNREENALTRAQAIGIDGHFSVEQGARAWSGLPLNFNGTCGTWRRTAIADAGGWQSDTLTEDMDLSYRAQLRGWRCAYREDVAVPGEIPAGLDAWRSQQFRWAKGSIECARKLLPRVWRSEWSWRRKLAATLHMTHYLVHPLILISLLMAPLALPVLHGLPEGGLVLGLLLLLCGMLPPLLLYAFSQRALQRRRGWRLLVDLPLLVAAGTGIAAANTRAVWQGLRRRLSAFVRTPKRGDGAGSYRIAGADGVVEVACAAWGLIGILVALQGRSPWLVPILALYVSGFLWMGARLFAARVRDALARDDRRPAPVVAILAPGLILLGALGALAARDTSWREEPGLFAGLGLAMAAAYLVGAALVRHFALSGRGMAVVALVGIAACLIGGGLWHSDDVARYMLEGAQLRAGQNPYSVPPGAGGAAGLVPDAIAERINHPEMTAIYPPLTLAYEWLVMSWWPSPAGFKAGAMALVILSLVAVLALLLRMRRAPGAMLLVAWNPVLPLFIAGEAHHDILMALFVVLALLSSVEGRGVQAVALGSLAALVKPFAVVLLPLLVLRAGWRRTLVLPPLIAAIAYVPFADAGTGLVRSLLHFGGEMHYHGALEPVFRRVLAPLIADGSTLALAVRALLLLTLLGALGLAWRRWRDAESPLLAARFFGILLLCSPTLHPWYFCGLVLLLPFVNGWGAVLWTGTASIYWLHGIGMLEAGEWIESPAITAAAHLPAAALMAWEAFGPRAERRRREGAWIPALEAQPSR